MNKPETDSIWMGLGDELLITFVESVVRSIKGDSNTEIEADGVCCFIWSEPRLDVMMVARL